MNKEIQRKIEKFESTTGHKLVYLTISGSKLYGTSNKNSDTDLKGIFIPSVESLLLQNCNHSYTDNSNNSMTKNDENDIDFGLHSVHNFFNHLEKSETGAIDLLFSMFRKDTIVYEDKEFTNTIKENYKIFLNSQMKSFIGYALSQTKKYNVKGNSSTSLNLEEKKKRNVLHSSSFLSDRYRELETFYKEFQKLEVEDLNQPISESFKDIQDIITMNKMKYIKFSWLNLLGREKFSRPNKFSCDFKKSLLNPPKNARSSDKIKYIDILGKTFHGNIKFSYFLERIKEQFEGFGNRTKSIAKTSFCKKSSSHSIRIAMECQELLETGFIKFPLTYADLIKSVKYGDKDMGFVVSTVESVLKKVDKLLETSDLPKTCDRKEIDKLLLRILRY